MADIEAAFEASKAERLKARYQFESAKGNLHMQLMARRTAGEVLTIADMKAILAAAIDNNELVKSCYLRFVETDAAYRAAKVRWEDAKRQYWDQKDARH